MFDLVIIGHIGFENILEKEETITYYGGAAYYSAVPSSIFSKNVGVVSRIGRDFDFDKLKRSGIDLIGVRVIKEGLSSQFSIKYRKDNFEGRQVRGELNVGNVISLKDIPKSYLNAKYVHVATAPPKHQIKWIKYIQEKSKAKVSIDTVEEYIRWYKKDVIKALSLADIVFINKREKELIRKLQAKTLVLKKGADGAEYIVKGKSLYSIPAPKAKVVDPTGSGDVVAGVFLTLMAQSDGDYKKSLNQAVQVASKSVTDYGVDFLLDKKVVA